MLKREENMVKLGATLPLKQMIAYGRWMKVSVVQTPPSPPPNTIYTITRRIRNVGSWRERSHDIY
jgi:hypothetical protein